MPKTKLHSHYLIPKAPGGSHVARVLGADASEGLDFQGTFAYAVNVGPDGATGPIHDANFTADSAPGIYITTRHNKLRMERREFMDRPAC